MNFSIHQASHIGNRKYNQDRVAYAYDSKSLLLVLADGMGGHLHGEMAANRIVETFVESFGRDAQNSITDPQGFLSQTMQHANQRIMDFPHDRGQGAFPGSTCVAALVQDGKICWGHAGDSRLYLLRDGAVLTKTRDHSMVYQWLEWGVIDAEEARTHPQRNQITNCLGGAEGMFYMEPGTHPVTLQSGDVLLLCSDGLWGPFSDQELVQAFSSKSLDASLDQLIVLAMERESGSSDNVTAVVVRWGENEPEHSTDEPVCHVLETA